MNRSFESTFRSMLDLHGVEYVDNSRSRDRLDFSLHVKSRSTWFSLELKEKRQRIYTTAWPEVSIPERHLFILDDQSARRVLLRLPHSAVAVRDNLSGRYFFFGGVDLALMPKVRVNRPVNRSGSRLKGKWMVDFRNGVSVKTIDQLLAKIVEYIDELHNVKTEPACYGVYKGEHIGVGGEPRSREHKRLDFGSTR